MEEGGDPQLPSISAPRTTSEGAGGVDLDLLEQLLSGDNGWLEVVSRSPNSVAFPPLSAFFSADATATTVTTAAPAANASWWIQTGGASPSSVEERFSQALSYIRDTQSDGDVLVQLWVPVNRDDGKLVLTTSEQPFTLDHRSDSLLRFREVSTKYQFSADVKSGDSPGLPGRVFIGRLPEWSPDIRYFTSYEYPRVRDAQYLDVHGTMGLPVFEKGSYNCLGVIELIMTRQKINFTSELNTICSALQAVNLRSTEVSSIPRIKDVTEKANGGHHSSRSPSSPNPKQNTDANMRVKATFGSEKVRFRLNPECNFQELKHEIAKRLSIVDTNPLVLKYLDDDSEWVLMTCDADLQECLHVYKLAGIQTIKISVHLAVSPATRVTTGHTGLS
ncbi:Protein NLP2 [Zea mays]|uniref:Protein NLP2 n=1 Tax=Zea mays TaxID=4577 RepID=A0A1D6IB17_MAIZE|nr:Protein NLP2 [Zea mays]